MPSEDEKMTSSEANGPTKSKAPLGRDAMPVRGKINVGPSFKSIFLSEDVEYVRPDDRGLGGLLTRHVGTTEFQWKHFLSKRKPGSRRSIFFLPLADPYSIPAKTWMAFMLAVDLIYTAFVVPVSVAFCTDRFAISATDACTQVDIVGGAIYLANFILMFQCGIVVVHRHMKIVIMDGLDVAQAYFFSWRCVLDIISFLPFIYLLIILGQQPQRSITTHWVQLVSLVRLLRMLRMLSISKMVSVDSASGRYKQLPVIGGFLSVPIMYLLLLVYILAVLINLEACILILSAYLHPRDMTVFWDAIEWEDVWSSSQAYQWYAAMYWAITTSTSTGYGDITPQNRTEKVLSNCMMILGMISFGLLIGAFGNLLTRASATAHALYTQRKKIHEVDDWLRKRGLSLDSKLQSEIEAYFFEYWSPKRSGPGPEISILADLPSSLRAAATERIALPFLRLAPPLGGLPDRIQRAIARLLRPVEFFPGQDICVQGHEVSRMWVCESGLIVAMQHGGEQVQSDEEARQQQEMHKQGIGLPPAPVRLVHVPCLLAESVILDEIEMCKTHLWTYRALAQVQAWELHIKDLWSLLRMFPEIKVKMLLYARDRLCRDLAGEERADNDFCELSELMKPCLDQEDLDSGKVEDLITDLLHADIESGELSHVLSVLAEVCTVQPWYPSSVLRPDAPSNHSRFGSRHSTAADNEEDGLKLSSAVPGKRKGSTGEPGVVGATSAPLSLDKHNEKDHEGVLSRLRSSLTPLTRQFGSVGRFSMPTSRHHRLVSAPPSTYADGSVSKSVRWVDSGSVHGGSEEARSEAGNRPHAATQPPQDAAEQQSAAPPPAPSTTQAAAAPALHDTPFLSPAAAQALQQQLGHLPSSTVPTPSTPATQTIPEGYDPSLPLPPQPTQHLGTHLHPATRMPSRGSHLPAAPPCAPSAVPFLQARDLPLVPLLPGATLACTARGWVCTWPPRQWRRRQHGGTAGCRPAGCSTQAAPS